VSKTVNPEAKSTLLAFHGIVGCLILPFLSISTDVSNPNCGGGGEGIAQFAFLYISPLHPYSGDIKSSFNWLEYQQRLEGCRLPQNNIVVRA